MNTLHLQFGKQRWLIIWFSLVLVSVVAFPVAGAETMSNADIEAWCEGGSLDDEQDVGEYIKGPEQVYVLEQPISGVTSVKTAGEYLQLVYQLGLGLVGIIAVVIIMFGGMMWVQAAGNEQSISKAKELIMSAAVGLLIALLSYTILVFVNPEILRTELNIAVIPEQVSCPYPPPEVDPFPDYPNSSACPSYVAAFNEVVQRLATLCPSCKIGVGSAYRSADEQKPLRECYERAIDEGYYQADGLTPVGGKSCPSGCQGCNVAAKPCCSNHQRGFAADLWFEYDPSFLTIEGESFFASAGVDLNLIASTSAGKLSMGCNDGACEEDSNAKIALANNQALLKALMEENGLFSKDSSEWWHFNLVDRDSCAVAVNKCVRSTSPGDMSQTSNFYCASSSGLYTGALCSVDGIASCSNLESSSSWHTINVNCEGDKKLTFDESKRVAPDGNVFSAAPTCLAPFAP